MCLLLNIWNLNLLVHVFTCIREGDLSYDYEIDFETEEVSLVQSDWWDDFAVGFQTEFFDLRWENEVAYFTLKK